MERAALKAVATEVVNSRDRSFGNDVLKTMQRLERMEDPSLVPRGDNILMAAVRSGVV